MKIPKLLAGLFLLTASIALALPNPEAEADTARAKSTTLLVFRVVAVRYEQRDDFLFTFADAQVTHVSRSERNIKPYKTR